MDTFIGSTWSLTEVCGGVIAGTCALWFAGGQLASRSAASVTGGSSNVAYCEKRCTMATYEHASITEAELSKLQSSPRFLQWLRENEGRLRDREDANSRVALWQSLSLLTLIFVATMLLPFTTFDLNSNDSKTLNDILCEVSPLPRKLAALIGIGTVVCSLFVPESNKSTGRIGAIVGLVVCLAAGDAIGLGAGYVTLLAAVAARIFVL